MTFDIEKELREYFNITDEEMNALSQLASELWHGPYYIPVNPQDAEDELVFKGETYYFCGWGVEATTESAFHLLIKLLQPTIDSLTTVYYQPDCGSLSEREPEGYWLSEYDDSIEPNSEEDYYDEPMEYYRLDVCDILGQLVGEQTAREIWAHF